MSLASYSVSPDAYDLGTFVIATLTALMFAILSACLYFLYTIISLKRLPKLKSISRHVVEDEFPNVSVILPA